MRPDESIEDVLKRITLEQIALADPQYGRGTASVEAKETRAELSGEERSQFFSSEAGSPAPGSRGGTARESQVGRLTSTPKTG